MRRLSLRAPGALIPGRAPRAARIASPTPLRQPQGVGEGRESRWRGVNAYRPPSAPYATVRVPPEPPTPAPGCARWLVLLLLLLLPMWRNQHREPYPDVLLPSPPPCPEDPEPQLTVVATDDSGSTRRSDPFDRRYPEARGVLDWLADGGACHPDDTVAVVHFGDVASDPVVVLHGNTVLEAAGPALAGPDPQVGGGTDILAAIDVADDLAASHPDPEPRLVLATDGELSSDAYPQTVEAVGRWRGGVSAVALGGALPDEWAGAPIEQTVLDRGTRFGDIAYLLSEQWITDTRPELSGSTRP